MSDAWIGVMGTLFGAVIGFVGSWWPKYQDDQRKRRALATGLLSEIRWLELSLRDIHSDETAAYRIIEPFQTAVYDQAGASLLLFKGETVRALNTFYSAVHELRTTLAQPRMQYPDTADLRQRYPQGHKEHKIVQIMATNAANDIRETGVMARLDKDEGGLWPDKLPPTRVRLERSQLEVPTLGPSVFEDQK